MNLGFTADDDRETVLQNRRLLVEAVTGDPATPLVALKQIHSKLVRLASAADASREQPHRADIEIGSFLAPLRENMVDVVHGFLAHHQGITIDILTSR